MNQTAKFWRKARWIRSRKYDWSRSGWFVPRGSWRRPFALGFSMIEALVVLVIAVAVMSISFPVISSMGEGTRISGAVNSISVAVLATRAYAMRQISFVDTDPGTAGDQFSFDGYSGTAAVFTPVGEIRLVENIATALSTGSNPLEVPTSTYPKALNGYEDIAETEYVMLPRGVGVVGISRGAGGLELLPPPFAVRFNEYGHLISGRDTSASRDRLVYYNGDYDTATISGVDYPTFQLSGTGNDRSSPYGGGTYDVDEWNPESGEYAPGASPAPGFDTSVRRYRLPFEEIETVIGVMVYIEDDFRLAGLNWGTSTSTDLNNWLTGTTNGQDNSRVLFISRYTGAVIREGNL